ncbi:dTDP-4-amino-4,6-dideoxygalactose transaminase [bacterium SCSIO 12741]|nr:dTDP-4-amino-4,6-dideoxygalactose transaminase [bacterium SCSIO 12741]
MTHKKIVFNKPYFTGQETEYILDAIDIGQLSGNGAYTRKCQAFFEERYSIKKGLLTTSCTHALEMSAVLLNLQPGDEVILPSYTFVSTANAFALKGAKLRFIDSRPDHPGMDEEAIESLITPKTKLIVPVHYAGVACDMDPIMEVAKKHGVYVVEDAAQAIDSFYKGRSLGSIGQMATFSFHETKNVISGEGGLIAINDDQWVERSEIVWEKGTNRSAFFRGEIDKYGWVDLGSSYLPSEMIAAFLYAQLQNLEAIQSRRAEIWNLYWEGLKDLNDKVRMPVIPDYATNNYHMFYLVCDSLKQRSELIKFLKEENIHAVFHYQSLHQSDYFKDKHDGRDLSNCDRYSSCLVRLPFYAALEKDEQLRVIERIRKFYL